MGSLFSQPYVSKPSSFATEVETGIPAPVTAEKAQSAYETYDYVVVGGGEFTSACGYFKGLA